MTFLAPAVRWPLAFSESVNRPVDSITKSTPRAFQGSWAGSLVAMTHLILWPLTTSMSFSAREGSLFSVADLALELAVDRVVLQLVGEVVGVGGNIDDRDHVDRLAQQPLIRHSAGRPGGRCGRTR